MCTTNSYTGRTNCNCPACKIRDEHPSILQEIFAELDYLLGAHTTGRRLTDSDKDSYRAQAIRGRNKILEWKKKCKELKKQGNPCEVHHVIPLQYAHLFKGKNPNRKENVLLLSRTAHDKIHANLAKALAKASNNKERKGILEKFRKNTMAQQRYADAKVPSGYSDSILREILQEANLSD
jgi:hypothetical protein